MVAVNDPNARDQQGIHQADNKCPPKRHTRFILDGRVADRESGSFLQKPKTQVHIPGIGRL